MKTSTLNATIDHQLIPEKNKTPKRSQKKLRLIVWGVCVVLNFILYALEGNGFSEMLSGLNVFAFLVFSCCIVESFLFINRKVMMHSAKPGKILLSSVAGTLIGIGLAIAILFGLFWGLMFLIYGLAG